MWQGTVGFCSFFLGSFLELQTTATRDISRLYSEMKYSVLCYFNSDPLPRSGKYECLSEYCSKNSEHWNS